MSWNWWHTNTGKVVDFIALKHNLKSVDEVLIGDMFDLFGEDFDKIEKDLLVLAEQAALYDCVIKSGGKGHHNLIYMCKKDKECAGGISNG